MCCNHGKWVVSQLTPLPPELLKLYSVNTANPVDRAHAKEFQNNICMYNSALAMTSLGVNIDCSLNQEGGPYVFKIQGALYHRMGSLLPSNDNQQKRYAELYFSDSHNALDQRMNNNQGANRVVMQTLQDMLYHTNPFVNQFKAAFERVCETPNVQNLTVRLLVDPKSDQCRYNAPTADEVVAIVPGESAETTGTRDVICQLRGGAFQRISEGHPSYQPLHYVLLFPRGEQG
ncbi:hypothetical protein JAAARDRAFT_61092 [Jaapia argillacea MUCL 33604]|uniref:Helitron helicase-like domain-containing protein n=1 Tax=Jaapia argillacea MUCL 33604 TaxID=933084 RepID=A0A067PFW8_9AGAM|nr:hypothetical protein JAAARDRAFT_61092 [Jaapia argillacea MUCL 33604]